MEYKNQQDKVVAANEFHKYVPGIRTLEKHPDWSALKLDAFDLPSTLEEPPPTPGILDHSFGIFTNNSGDQAQCNIDGRRIFAGTKRPGHICVLPHLQSISWEWRTSRSQDQPTTGLLIYLSSKTLEIVALETLGIDENSIEVLPSVCQKHDPFIRQVAIELAEDLQQSNPINRIYAESLTQVFALHVLNHYCATSIKSKEYKTGLSPHLLEIVTDYVDENLDTDLSLDELAKLCNIGNYYFIRLFKQSIGVTPHQYVMQRRIKKAKRLLKATNWGILQIAIETGYKNSSSFGHSFKTLVGVSPSEYRR